MKSASMAAGMVLAVALGGVTPGHAQASGDIKIVLGEEPDLMDPCMATRSNIGRILLENISETLTELEVQGEGDVKPRLAKSWKQVDDKTWRFYLRRNVTFSDGSRFDAQDVVHSFERAESDKNSCEVSRYYDGMDLKMKAVDDHTLEVTSDEPQPILPLLMSLLTIVPSDTPMDFIREPIGTGPYKLESWKPGQSVHLVRRDDYWGDKPAVASATYLFRSDSAVRAAMVRTGEADIAPSIAPVDATDDKLDKSYPNSETTYLRIDSSVAPFKDVRVRKALNLAIDREAFVGTILAKGTKLAQTIVPPSTFGWNPDIKPFPYDPAEAKKLLAAAKADGVPVDKQITLIGRTDNFPGATETYETIASMLNDVGFDVKVQMVEVAEHEQYYSKPFVTDKPILVGAQHDNSRGDPVFSMYFKYDSKGRQSGIGDPHVDQLIEQASAAKGDERRQLWQQLFAYLHDKVVADVLLFHMVGFARVGTHVTYTPTIATNSQLQLSQVGLK